MTNLGKGIVDNVILFLFKLLYEAGSVILGNRVPSEFYLAFAFLAAMTIPTLLVIVFRTLRKVVIVGLIILWALFLFAILLY